jgi:hypothetical protein
MNSERCWQLGLIVSELITSAARHAFGNCIGVIRGELLPSASLVECRVTDYGEGTSSVSPGRGLRIVAALARSPGDTIDQGYGPPRSTSAVIFPANPGTWMGQANSPPSRREGITKASFVNAVHGALCLGSSGGLGFHHAKRLHQSDG